MRIRVIVDEVMTIKKKKKYIHQPAENLNRMNEGGAVCIPP